MKHLFLFILAFLVGLSLQAQAHFPLQITGSYYSEALLYEQAFSSGSKYHWFNNQGGSLSANYTLLSFDTKGSKAQGNTGSLKLQALLTGAVYQIENQSINTLITGGLGIEKDFRFGLFLFGNIQAGLLHSNFYVPTYSVNSQGQLIETEAKESYAIAPFSIGFGWNFNRQLGIPVGVKASTFSFYKPYGDSDYLKNGMMIGIEWRFNNLKLPTIYSL